MQSRAKYLVSFVAVTVAISACAFCFLSHNYFFRVKDADTFLVERGMTREQVKEILGPPNHTESDGKYWAYYTWEGGLLAPLFPVYIHFDEDGRVLAVFV